MSIIIEKARAEDELNPLSWTLKISILPKW